MPLTWISNASREGTQPWRQGLLVGLPRATACFTVGELMDQEIIGLYAKIENTQPATSTVDPQRLRPEVD